MRIRVISILSLVACAQQPRSEAPGAASLPASLAPPPGAPPRSGAPPHPTPAAKPADPAGAPAPIAAPSNVASDVAVLPYMVSSLQRLPLAFLRESGMRTELGVMGQRACFDAVAARIDGLYYAGLAGPATDELVPLLVHGVTVAQLGTCIPKAIRRASKDPRVIVFEDDGVHGVVAPIAPGWLFVGHTIAAASMLLRAPPVTDNPLARLATRAFATETWRLSAADYTTEVLGVPSLGASLEVPLDGGPAIARLYFADAAAARLALTRFERPGTSVYEDRLAEARAWLAQRGAPAVVDATIEMRGTLTNSELGSDTPVMIFQATATPLAPSPR
jgi:hypothetical protein